MIKEPEKVRTRTSGRAIIVEIAGDIGRGCPPVEELYRQASERRSRLAILDFSNADRIDSSGLEWLEQVTARLEPAGVKVRVVAPEDSRVRRTLRLMKFDRFLLVLTSLFDAVTFGRRRRSRKTEDRS